MGDSEERMEELVDDIEDAVDDLKELVGGEEPAEKSEKAFGTIDYSDPEDAAKFYEFKKRNSGNGN